MKNLKYIFIIFGFLLLSGVLLFVKPFSTTNKIEDLRVQKVYSAVSLSPTEEWIKKYGGNEEYIDVVADGQYYTTLSEEYLIKRGVKVTYSTKKDINFTKLNGETIKIDRDETGLDSWGIILFDGVNDPYIAKDITDISYDYNIYFGNSNNE